MKKIFLIFILLFVSPMLSAEPLLGIYVARLGSNDHFNSSGKRLTSVAAIIRQDRANFHKLGLRDIEDQNDFFFVDKSNRTLLEEMLNRGFVSNKTRNSIIDGSPIIIVNIYKNHIKVYLQ